MANAATGLARSRRREINLHRPDTAELTRGLEMSVGYVLRRAQLAVFADFIAAQSAPVSRPGQFALLALIGTQPGVTQTQLCDALGIKRANLVVAIDQFERLGLVRREQCSVDRRANRLQLTPAGTQALSRAAEAQRKHESRITALLGANGRRVLIELLNKLRTLSRAAA
jgi:DNA-binding MarR family transcriptional regulator